jgi:undecaprenyl-diphosphatase
MWSSQSIYFNRQIGMNVLQVIILSLIQGVCELLPVSSSAHVLVAAKLMGINPSSPEMTFLLVMLHTGTMFAVIVYFWRSWRHDYFSSSAAVWNTGKNLVAASATTAVIGGILLVLIEKVVMRGQPHAEVESLFSNLAVIACALAAVGVLILIAGRDRGDHDGEIISSSNGGVNLCKSAWIGAMQGLCLPFRGFSRSGATISTGLILGVTRLGAERFSFALAVILTPPVIVRELLRLIKVHESPASQSTLSTFALAGLGMLCSFLAGLLALRWLTRLLERGRWQWFGYYCLVAALTVFLLHITQGS